MSTKETLANYCTTKTAGRMWLTKRSNNKTMAVQVNHETLSFLDSPQ